ncbi:DUF4112 domain-containing protein [Aliiroseovarius sp. F20344]|uniref:DUF4112 domain-containing protein n=1 Tax=Aliiroseovarius sp. F20344 TaxID=2926414 RepID=UPI001FF14431|nr:DUF4112 domain-containing protein [Aliiroseovarius sp. F20344]MCK0143494.1 DUF4112 domain-containing protein [Aliiroseovarius sp. F20344]
MNINRDEKLKSLEKLAYRLENLIPIPGTELRFGLDAVMGLAPVVGDFMSLIPGGYIMYEARKLGAPNLVLARMGLNLAADVVIGLTPVIGDAFDMAWNANTRNVRLLRDHLETQTAHADHSTGGSILIKAT